MLFGTSVGKDSKQPFKFGGKEYITAKGFNTYDFGARGMDSSNPRWTSVDQMAEKYPHISPYAYCANNPIRYVDPDGKEPITLTRMAVGAIIGATIDFGAQMAVNMIINNNSVVDAARNIDWTSVGAASVAGAVNIPGMASASKISKVVTATVFAVDAAVDVSIEKGVNVVGDTKSVADAAIDLGTSFIPGEASSTIKKTFNGAVEADLKAGKHTMSKATKAELSSLQKTATSIIDYAVQPVLDFATKGTTAAVKNAASTSVSTTPSNQKKQAFEQWQRERQTSGAHAP